MDKLILILSLLLSINANEIVDLMSYMDYAKYAHGWWAEHVSEFPEYVSVVGDREWNLMWVDKYSKVLKYLELLLKLKKLVIEFYGSDDMLVYKCALP